ncbi:ATP-binding cassette domain-containing protein [Corynebacterium sp. NPDC060344]|uniref:ATP-binding cassette domain-containing protein n=1 Tax=Corynebacterium sp. NPDC060344 TaxID=3347101 RepID=UPI00364D41AA
MARTFRVDGATYRYRRAKAEVLNHIDVEMTPGPVLLLGRNGAGKTTLLKLIAGLIRPTAGKVSADGRVVYLPQKFVAVNGFTCHDYVAYVAWLNGRPRAAAKRDAAGWLGKVGLADLVDRPCPDLSGGQQARLALAMALNSGADLVLLDEPGASLDPLSKETLRGLYQLVVDSGSALVVSSHDPTDIHGPFHRIVIIDGGRVVFDAGPTEFKSSTHADPLVAAFARSMHPGAGEVR